MLKVKRVTLHEAYFPGGSSGPGNLPNKLDTDGDHKGMEITWTPAGVFIEFKGTAFGIPLAACKGYTFSSPADMRTYLHMTKTGTTTEAPNTSAGKR